MVASIRFEDFRVSVRSRRVKCVCVCVFMYWVGILSNGGLHIRAVDGVKQACFKSSR